MEVRRASRSTCFILAPMVLMFATCGCVGAHHEGSSRELSTGSTLRDFLPKAPSIAKYEGTRVYADGSTSKITHTSYLIRISEEGREHLVRTYEEEEETAVGLQSTEATTVYEVASGHIAVVSANMTKRGAMAPHEGRTIYDPPWILLRWPLRTGERWEQSVLSRIETEREKWPKEVPVNISSVVRGEETIHTPAGTFRTWRIEQTVTEDQEKFTYWWAKGRWLVKWRSEGRENSSLEVVDFKESVR